MAMDQGKLFESSSLRSNLGLWAHAANREIGLVADQRPPQEPQTQ